MRLLLLIYRKDSNNSINYFCYAYYLHCRILGGKISFSHLKNYFLPKEGPVKIWEIECVVRGYHVYKRDWKPDIGDIFETEVEDFDDHDRYAVAVQVDGDTVGHLPKEVSKICYFFIRNGGCITGKVIGSRKLSSVFMKGLEIP